MRSRAFFALASKGRGLAAALALALPLAAPAAAGSAAFLAFTGVALQADASLHLEVSIDHLVTVADVVVDGIPEEATSQWEDIPTGGRRIVTYTRVKVAQAAYGKAGSDVWVRTLGGQVGDIGQKVEGEAVLVPGERSVLFLKAASDGPHRVVEMAQGQYVVRTDEGAERLKISPYLGRVLPSKDEKTRSRSARTLLHHRPVAEAIQLIQTARKETGR